MIVNHQMLVKDIKKFQKSTDLAICVLYVKTVVYQEIDRLKNKVIFIFIPMGSGVGENMFTYFFKNDQNQSNFLFFILELWYLDVYVCIYLILLS